jgi:hypothetical protein
MLSKGILFAECHLVHSAKAPSTLPIAECLKKVLDKEVIVDVQFAELSLPSVTLGKTFAECFLGFDECCRHLAKKLIPIVSIIFFCSSVMTSS